MEEKKKQASTTVTRNTADFDQLTGNIYETVAMLTKRANQIAAEEKKELHNKIDAFKSSNDMFDDMYENREQVEIVRRYERQPKPTIEATEEYLEGDIYYRNPSKENQQQKRLEVLEDEIIKEM
ncbi:MAG: DNA-directed RNA polymerase subunit omega [Bacteroidales bacterium]|nr:DNA-directed RNA polymerase subunit omega [Bacteroidales bacterium]MBR1850668.1 DNA-directed RNA polymerase subunit omega [Bacteroidales bacterium]